MEAVDASAARLVKLRYFVGMTVSEAGESLGLLEMTSAEARDLKALRRAREQS